MDIGEKRADVLTPDPHDHPHFPNILDQLCLQKGIKFLGAVFGLITLILPEPVSFNFSIPKSRPLRLDFPGGSDSKESACSGGDLGSIPGLGSPPGEGKGYPLQYSCLENFKDRGAWWATVHGGHKESDTSE